MSTPLGTFSGIASGMDFYALTDQIISIERRPAIRLEEKIALAESRKKALSTYRTLLSAFESAAADFADASALQAYSASLSNAKGTSGQTLLSASASEGAVPGKYTLQVSALAAAQKNVGTAQASSGTALNLDGTIDIKGQQVVIGTADSLTAIRDKINAVNAATGVTASILKVSDTDHRLVLAADETGTANSFTPTNVTGTVVESLGLASVSTAAADASFSVDGVAMTRSSNTVTDAIQGVTLTLQGAEVGHDVGLEVTRYTAAAQDAAKAFVDAYNKIVEFTKSQNNGGPASSRPLYGDSTLRANRGALATELLSTVAGSPTDLNSLGMAGIALNKDGLLELDIEKFKTAFETRFEDLKTLVQDRGAALEGYLDGQIQEATGILALKDQSITDSISSMESRVTDIDARLERRREAMIRRWTMFESRIGMLQSLQQQMATQFQSMLPSKD